MISVEFELKKPNEMYFEELAEGTYFRYADALYFKLPPLYTEKMGFKINAYNLAEGRVVMFNKRDLIMPISDDRIKIKVRMGQGKCPLRPENYTPTRQKSQYLISKKLHK